MYKVVLTFVSMDEILSKNIQMRATGQHTPLVVFIMLHIVHLQIYSETFELVDEILLGSGVQFSLSPKQFRNPLNW